MKTMFNAQVIKPYEAYLDLPSLVGRSKNNTFAHLKQRVANKVSGWKEKLLTHAGKEVLMKSVAQAVPSYTMSCFLLPKKLCGESCMAELGQNVHAKGQWRARLPGLEKFQFGFVG